MIIGFYARVGLGIGGMSRKHKMMQKGGYREIKSKSRHGFYVPVINSNADMTFGAAKSTQIWMVGLGNGAPCDKASTWKLRKGSKSLDKVWLFHRFCLDCLCCPLSRHFEEFLPYGQLSDHYPLYKVCSVPLV
uniref:Endonuclease/exonuclease/phosphatase domain-containing protein n=1 Tax=Oryza punctata TaxID=4537 RepID=A0A0E0L490_ORYPU